MKSFNPNKFENMMMNIVDEGKIEVWNEIEKEKCAIKRCQKRKLYSEALQKISESEDQDNEE